MAGSQSAQLSKAEKAHLDVIWRDPKYKETAHWHPVIIPNMRSKGDEIVAWLEERKLQRGTQEARNDYLIPVTGFFLFKDSRMAVEFKLTWG